MSTHEARPTVFSNEVVAWARGVNRFVLRRLSVAELAGRAADVTFEAARKVMHVSESDLMRDVFDGGI